MKILIAEDDAVASEVQQLNLEHIGQEVVITRTGTEAWETFDRADRIGIQRWYLPPECLEAEMAKRKWANRSVQRSQVSSVLPYQKSKGSNGGSLYGPVAAVTDD